MQGEAAQSVARELALEAVADKAGIEVSDDDVKALIREQAEAAGDDPDEVIDGHLGARPPGDAARGPATPQSALDRLVADVKPISMELAEARDKLWTPDKENTEPEKKLWTPGSKEPE